MPPKRLVCRTYTEELQIEKGEPVKKQINQESLRYWTKNDSKMVKIIFYSFGLFVIWKWRNGAMMS